MQSAFYPAGRAAEARTRHRCKDGGAFGSLAVRARRASKLESEIRR
jgi:hypothetical protein